MEAVVHVHSYQYLRGRAGVIGGMPFLLGSPSKNEKFCNEFDRFLSRSVLSNAVFGIIQKSAQVYSDIYNINRCGFY